MTLYYYMYRSWQDCCRRGENRSWPSVSVESVDSEYWCLNNVMVYAFIMRLTVEERVLGPLLSWTSCILSIVIAVKFTSLNKANVNLFSSIGGEIYQQIRSSFFML